MNRKRLREIGFCGSGVEKTDESLLFKRVKKKKKERGSFCGADLHEAVYILFSIENIASVRKMTERCRSVDASVLQLF